MSDTGIAVLVVVGCVALVLLRLVMPLVAIKAGRAARERTIARTGKDPADNRFNNGANRWADQNPLGAKVLLALVALFGVVVGMWRVAT